MKHESAWSFLDSNEEEEKKTNDYLLIYEYLLMIDY
jgi:hypothetical protein